MHRLADFLQKLRPTSYKSSSTSQIVSLIRAQCRRCRPWATLDLVLPKADDAKGGCHERRGFKERDSDKARVSQQGREVMGDGRRNPCEGLQHGEVAQLLAVTEVFFFLAVTEVGEKMLRKICFFNLSEMNCTTEMSNRGLHVRCRSDL